MSGDLPRPIKGGSLHHPHGVYNSSVGSSTGGGSSNGHNNVHHPYSQFNFSQPHPFSTASSSSAPPRPEFATPVLPQNRARALVQSSPLGPGAQNSIHSVPGPSSVSVPASRRGRRPYAGERHDAIWSPEVQEAFLQGVSPIWWWI